MMVMTMRLMMMEVKETALQPPLPRLMGSNGLSDWIINPPATHDDDGVDNDDDEVDDGDEVDDDGGERISLAADGEE